MGFFNDHNHTVYSNLRLIDCINKPKALIDKAIQLGLSGIAITDHEALCCHIEVNQYAKKLQEINPDFTIALGNEIYLIDQRFGGQKYYHFILIAKDAKGHRILRELSSKAWYNGYEDRGFRVPLLKSELQEIMDANKGKGHIIATTACMGGELSTLLRGIEEMKSCNLDSSVMEQQVTDFVNWCVKIFGQDDFYIECAPSKNKDQVIVNKLLYQVADQFGLKMIPGTDSHYLSKDLRFAHKAYLNSKDGDREVDEFYEYAYLMDESEVRQLLHESFTDQAIIDWLIANTEIMRQSIQFYDLTRPQKIPLIQVEKTSGSFAMNPERHPTLWRINCEGNDQEKRWLHDCMDGFVHHGINVDDKTDYMDRLETEAYVISFIGDRLGTCLFAYFNTFAHYINLFWDCGSTVGPGRGSATGFLSNYLLGITQLDPIRWGLPWWRFLNKERAELPDIDIDLAPSKRPLIFERIREERGELGCVQVVTFGTEGAKSAIQTACRGYRYQDEDGNEVYPNGIDNDIALYISSLIPQERGFLWPFNDCIYGNESKNRRPIATLITELNKYPGLTEIIQNIDGCVKQRGIHASGVILYNNDLYETGAIMRAASGEITTCYDLHMCEAAGDTKYDFLVTEVCDKMIQCLELLKKDGVVEDWSIRDLYNKYLHPEKIDTDNPEIWQHLAAGDILDVFQFNSGVGLSVAKSMRPQNPLEMTAANAMMRLMNEPGVESQQDRYVRIKQGGIDLFEKEMTEHHLPQKMKERLHHYCDTYYGCSAIQEQMMEILMDEEIAGFTLKEANDARKIVGKKQMNRIPELRARFNQTMSSTLAEYVWKLAVAPQLGYAFSINHSLPYSFVGIQTIILATKFNPVYWNSACLIVNSGATDPEAGGSTNYEKIAKAVNDIMGRGIKVAPVDINKSEYGFVPNAEKNEILFGMKGLLNVGDDVVATIIEHRPYDSFGDFMTKVRLTRQPMIALIKSGAFDQFGERKKIMATYLYLTCDKKKRITLQNMAGLIRRNMLPEELNYQRKVFEFNRYLKDKCSHGDYYFLDERAQSFIDTNYPDLHLDFIGSCSKWDYMLSVKEWNKIYKKEMDVVRTWMKDNQQEALYRLNKEIFVDDWNKYAAGTYSAWEMEVMCFYHHEHELAHVPMYKYGLVRFPNLPAEPIVESLYRGRIPIYKLSRIAGTVIAKNKIKSIVTILTVDGVVNVKFSKEYFAMFDRQISQRGADGVKHIVERSWFNRGSMIVVTGIRRGDEFVAKKYSSTPGHQLYKIDAVLADNSLVLRSQRAQGESEDVE